MVEREKLIAMVQGVQRGEEDAFTELYDTFHNDIYYHILKQFDQPDPELAAELTQDTFIKILRKIGDLQEPAAFVTWAKKLASSRCKDYLKKRRELLADEDEDGYSVFDTIEEDRSEFIPGEALDKEELKIAIQQMIDQLPAEQRSALLMRYFDEMSVKEIAEIQGVSEGTVKSRLNYARKAVKGSVEEYEKKHGVKLRCVGVLPLLFWLFQMYRHTSGATGVLNAASATAATGTAAATTTTVAAASAGGVAAKIIAGVAAAAVAVGGIAVAVHTMNKREPEPVQTTAATEPQYPRLWVGYDDVYNPVTQYRHELLITDMDETGMEGHLNISILYGTAYEGDLTGTGTRNDDGTVTYTAQLDTPLVMSTIVDLSYDTVELVYDPETEVITLNNPLEATVYPEGFAEPVVLAQDAKWSGIGEDLLCINYMAAQNHLFEVYVEEMTDSTIKGRLVVSKNGNVEHDTAFSGRGFLYGNEYRYEVALDEIRSVEWIGGPYTADYFWMAYYPETDVLKVDGMYNAKISRQN